MKKRYLFIVVLVMALLFAGGTLANNILLDQTLYNGDILDIQAFPDGSMLALHRQSNSVLWLQYHDVSGAEIMTQRIEISGGRPNALIYQTCGGYVQIVAGYTGYAKRYVLEIDGLPDTCYDRVFLPIAIK